MHTTNLSTTSNSNSSSVLDETTIFVNEVPQTIPPRNGRPVHVSTVHRWVHRGIAGHKLEAARLGGRWVTSLEALQRFMSRITSKVTHSASAPSRPEPKHGQANDIEADLEAAGL